MVLGLCAVAGAAEGQQPTPEGTPIGVPAVSPDARGIVTRAIARRREMLAAAGAYRYGAFSKLVVRDPEQPADSARSVLFLGETQSSVYARHPSGYQEIILAHRRSSDVGAERSVVTVGDIADFDRDRISLARYSDLVPRRAAGFGRTGGRRQSSDTRDVAITSPVANGATDRYDYRVLDTLAVGGHRVFRLAVVPRSGSAPLFVGTMEVADSTYDVVAMDLGVTDAVRFPSVINLRYQERLDDVGEGRWVPVEIRLSGEARPRITGPRLPERVAGIPVPRLPSHVVFEEVARLDSFRFGQADRPAGVGEYRIVVRDPTARGDSAAWSAPDAVPLSDAERGALARADSQARRPPGAFDQARQGIAFAAELAADPDFFHFNRVDGVYLGAGHDWRAASGVALHTKVGYALGGRSWQYEVGGRVLLSNAQRLWVGGSYHDETTSQPTLISSGYNPTFRALFAQLDPHDYYRERGLGLSLGTKVLDRTQLDVRYLDARQSSLGVVVATRSSRRPIRPNVPIAAGQLRSLSGTLTWDSRQLLRARGADLPLTSTAWTRITLSTELSAHDLLGSDFSYRRYLLQVERQQRTVWGTTLVSTAAGVATGWVPPQRYFTVDFGMEFLTFQGNGFNTLAETNYSGNRVAMIVVRHDFDRLLFHLPFTLSIHGGAFWTSFVNHPPFPADSLLVTAPRPYTEAGFGLGNLTPFLSPFDLSAHFTWQLSSYPTRRFRFGFSLGGL
jgi:hypothetical protein